MPPILTDPSLHPLIGQALRFGVTGVPTVAVHYGVLIALVELSVLAATPAALVAFVCGGVVSYLLNRTWTFGSDRAHAEAAPRFAAVAGVGFVLTAILMAFMVDGMDVPYLAAQVLTTGIVLIWTFAANRDWTFKAAGS